MTSPIIAVVGATGAVGREIITALGAKDHPGEAILSLATARTEGEEIDFEEETLPVEPVAEGSFRGVKVVVLAVPAFAARALADKARQAGAWVIDLSGAFAADPAVPLVAPGVGPASGEVEARLVALAHPLAQALALAVAPLLPRGVTSVDATLLVGAAAWGQAGVRALEQQTAALLSGRDVEPGPFPHRLAFNVLPQVGPFQGAATALELQVGLEAARLWGAKAPATRLTALAVPTFHGGMLTATVHLEGPISADAARAALKGSAELKLLDDPPTGVYPMPLLVTADPLVQVGRIRAQGQALQLVAAVDLVGRAAQNAATLALTLSSR